jgi:hypothetical protein
MRESLMIVVLLLGACASDAVNEQLLPEDLDAMMMDGVDDGIEALRVGEPEVGTPIIEDSLQRRVDYDLLESLV